MASAHLHRIHQLEEIAWKKVEAGRRELVMSLPEGGQTKSKEAEDVL